MKFFLQFCLYSCLLAACRAVPAAPPPGAPTEAEMMNAVIEALMHEVPPMETTTLVFVEIPPGPDGREYLGLTGSNPDTLDPSDLLVQIDNRQCFELALDTIEHEWAHVATWGAVQEESHDAMWGVAYARCYRIAHRVLDDLRLRR